MDRPPVPSRAKVVAEAGGWSVFIPGLPLAADGGTLDDAIADMIEALREYAEDWQDRLLNAPNHRDNWMLMLRCSGPASGVRHSLNGVIRSRQLKRCLRKWHSYCAIGSG